MQRKKFSAGITCIEGEGGVTHFCASQSPSRSASRLSHSYSVSYKGVTHATQKIKLFIGNTNFHKLEFTLAHSLLSSYPERTPIATSENSVYNLNIKFAIRLKL